MDTDTLLRLGLIFLLVGLNAFFVAAEYALVSVRRSRMQELAESGKTRARMILQTLDDINPMLSTVQVGVTMCSLGIGYLGEPAVADLLRPLLENIGLSGGSVTVIAFLLTFAFMTWITVILGELLPKNAALQKTDSVAMKTIVPMRFLAKLCTPINYIFSKSLKIALSIFRLQKATNMEEIHSEEELKLLVSQSSKGGVLQEQEQEMLYKVFDFADKSVAQVMVPRPDVVGFEENTPVDIILDEITGQPYSRYPIYEDSLDNVIGFLHARDLLNALIKQEDPTKINIRDLLRDTFIIPESKGLGELLKDMRQKQCHLALVADEHGTLTGVVALEDLLEELVGEIDDEHDVEREDSLRQVDANTLDLEGNFILDELTERFGIEFPEGDYQTIGGLIFHLLGRQPKVGDKVSYADLILEVTEVEGARILETRVRFQGKGMQS